MYQKDKIMKYTAFCGEKNEDCATCLKKFGTHTCWNNIWNAVFGWQQYTHPI